MTIKEVKKIYGISITAIRSIWIGKHWNSVTKKVYVSRKKLSSEIVKEIYYLSHFTNLPQKTIAELYGIKIHVVWDIKSGSCYGKITGHIKGQSPINCNIPASLQQKMPFLVPQTQMADFDITDLDYWLDVV